MVKGKKSKIITKRIVPKIEGALPEAVASFCDTSVPIRARRPGYGLSSTNLRFPNLSSSNLPYQYGTGCSISVSDAVLLCQKAYCRVGSFKNAIDILAEICTNSEIYLDEGNKESVTFFEAWLKRININKLKDQFFRELFRSGNIFLYRIDGSMEPQTAKKITKLYGEGKFDLPLRYILLNPCNIAVMMYGGGLSGLNFENPIYFRLLNKFEIDTLKNSENTDDKELYKSLPAAIKSYFDGGNAKPVQLDPKQLHTVFYKKQDYEPFASPLGLGVLDSIELKLAMQRCDSVLARSVEYAILLVTTGAKKDEGGVNPASLAALKEAFKSEDIGRILIADYTTKAEFVVPDLNKILGEAKYAAVNQDIAEGLMNIFFEQETRQVNLVPKVKLFVEKLTVAKNLFVNEFLAPEIKRISKLMGFKAYPIPCMGSINLDDQSQMFRIYTQLLQMGVLTPKDGLEAIERGIFPEYDKLHTNQETFKKDKDGGLFMPVTGSPYTQLQIAKLNAKTQTDLVDKQQEHTLEQTKLTQQHDIKKTKMQHDHQVANPTPPAPHLQVVTKPIGTPNIPKGKPNPTGRPPGAKGSISMAKLIKNVKLHSQLIEEVNKAYKEINKKKKLSEEDNGLIRTIVNSIMQVEEPNKWISSAAKFVKEPVTPPEDKIYDIAELSQEYGVSEDTAILVSHSINKDE